MQSVSQEFWGDDVFRLIGKLMSEASHLNSRRSREVLLFLFVVFKFSPQKQNYNFFSHATAHIVHDFGGKHAP